MDFIYAEPYKAILFAIAAVCALIAAVKGFRNFHRGMQFPDNPFQTLWVVKGIRGFIVSAGMIFLFFGLLLELSWPIYFGLAFIAEEILETGIMLLALRRTEVEEEA